MINFNNTQKANEEYGWINNRVFFTLTLKYCHLSFYCLNILYKHDGAERQNPVSNYPSQ